MKRGDLVTVSLSGGYGKPRPALIVQSDFFDQHPSITILPVTSELRETPLFRVLVEPTKVNGLKAPSQVMVDKAYTVLRDKIGKKFGRLSKEKILEVNRLLAVFLGFA